MISLIFAPQTEQVRSPSPSSVQVGATTTVSSPKSCSCPDPFSEQAETAAAMQRIDAASKMKVSNFFICLSLLNRWSTL